MVDLSLSSQLAEKETGDVYRQILPGVARFLVVKYTWQVIAGGTWRDVWLRKGERERERGEGGKKGGKKWKSLRWTWWTMKKGDKKRISRKLAKDNHPGIHRLWLKLLLDAWALLLRHTKTYHDCLVIKKQGHFDNRCYTNKPCA